MIKHVFFDCFGTLIDSRGVSAAATREILRSVGYDADPDEYYREWKKRRKLMSAESVFRTEKEIFALTLADMFSVYGIDADADREVKPMIMVLFGERSAFPDAKPALGRLDAMGTDYALASNTDDDSLYHFLARTGLSFERIFTSESLRVYKPDPRFYSRVLNETGWAADECLFVGDSCEEDAAAPKRAGMLTALLDRFGRYAGSDAPSADYVITTLGQLPGLIGSGEEKDQ